MNSLRFVKVSVGVLLMLPNNRLLSPLRDWDGLSAAARLQVRPKAGRYILENDEQ